MILGQENDTFPQPKVQHVQCVGSKVYFNGSDDGWEKTVTFRVLCKITDAKKATWRLPFIAYIMRGNVIFLFLVY